MASLLTRPLDESFALCWSRIEPSTRRAFFIALAVSVAAFGFEMTNLTLHHDDVYQVFIQHDKFQQYVGRYGFGWLHYYTQGAHFMPFIQLLEGMVCMAAYGVIIGRLWGLRRTIEIALVAAVPCVFPYMAQIYQYNSAMALYPLAHLLVAAAVWLSVSHRRWKLLGAVALYVAAFSIYQSVIACALAILAVWTLLNIASGSPLATPSPRPVLCKATIGLLCIGLGGALYAASVPLLGLDITSEHGATEAFELGKRLEPIVALNAIVQASRANYLWPENYYPLFLKQTVVLVLLAAIAYSIWQPRGLAARSAAAAIFLLLLLAPRALQFIHPAGTYHNLTLTGYAVVVAGVLAIVYRLGHALSKNLAYVAAITLLAGYVVQANWISTVGFLNTLAHYSQATQILARVRSLPFHEWNGETIVVAGAPRLFDEYPFKRATGISTDFLDAHHLQLLTRLLRDHAKVIAVEEANPALRQVAATLPHWPHPSSVAVVEGVALVVLGKTQFETPPEH